MYKQKVLSTSVAWSISIATFILVALLSYVPPVIESLHGVTSYSTFTNFDIPLCIVTALACHFLIGTFRTREPKRMYWGLYAYVWLLGLALCYIQSANERTLVFGLPALPLYESSLYGVLFALVATIILIVFHARFIILLSLMAGLSNEGKPRERQSEDTYQPYQQGYQSPKKSDRQKEMPKEEHGGCWTSHREKYVDGEEPKASYPQYTQDMQEQQ